ncbi:hypothetical protein [Micromonospora coerulea]|uniref:hypothetical protein n=1 Tax=Micromonospora coerulea TaxID=47856 RepID=UPI001906E638|nr:hypothetical protein [Micromonospora veneta]
MSYQTVFREAVGEIPPTSIDVEQVIRRQRRRHRLRRNGLAAVVGAAVLGVTVPFAIAGVSGPDLPASPASPSSTTQSARFPRPDPGTTFSATDLAVFAALSREAPDVEWITEDWPSDGDLVTWKSVGSTSPYFGQGPIRAGDRTGYFSMQLEQSWDNRVALCIPETTQENGCVHRTGPAGEKIQTSSNQAPITASITNRALKPRGMPAAPTSDRFVTSYRVAVERPDGTFLIVTMVADGEEPPLTLAQLTAVALDPAITLD